MAGHTVKKSLLWLASYPKSGNTWVRLFLLNYLVDRPEPVPINQAHRLGESDATFALYRAASADPSLRPTDNDAILRLRPPVLERLAGNGADVNFVKTHCRNGPAGPGRLIPPHLTRGAVYILRNPFDILPSYADHYAISLDTAAAHIVNRDNAVLGGGRMTAQYLGDWAHHLRSWTGERRFPVCTVRYEDLHADPGASYARILDFIGAPSDPARRDRAIAASSFAELRGQEDRSGFVEKSDGGSRFFRAGKAGGWREVLTDGQVAILHRAFEPTLRTWYPDLAEETAAIAERVGT